jgi:hypothetical protein
MAARRKTARKMKTYGRRRIVLRKSVTASINRA